MLCHYYFSPSEYFAAIWFVAGFFAAILLFGECFAASGSLVDALPPCCWPSLWPLAALRVCLGIP
jgi:hypothetical protein